MTKEELIKIIERGENHSVEFKTSFLKDIFETIVAFSNSKGGKIIVGCNDKKEIVGVSIGKESIQK